MLLLAFARAVLNGQDAAQVLDIPGVKAIRPVTLIPAPKYVHVRRFFFFLRLVSSSPPSRWCIGCGPGIHWRMHC